MRFPTVKTFDQDHQMVCLPDHLQGDFNLLLIGYGPWHWWQLDGWLPFMHRLEDAYSAFRYYVVPMIDFGRSQLPMNDLPSLVDGTRVLTVESNKKELRIMLGILTEVNISVLLVQRDGTILWRESGVWTTDKADALDSLMLSIAALNEEYDD